MPFKNIAAFIICVLVVGCSSKRANIVTPVTEEETLKICSFNVQFLGNSKLRDDLALASIVAAKECDVVTVQELVAPPDLRILPASNYFNHEQLPFFPNSEKQLVANEYSTEFFLAMHDVGFGSFWLSEEDTGTSIKNHTNGSSTEWWVTFYKSQKVERADDLPHGFLSSKVAANPSFDRVPYAFSFRSKKTGFDFVLISTHLHPGPSSKNKIRRKVELDSIYEWIDVQVSLNSERDYIILGDMNLENNAETKNNLREGWVSLNTDAAFKTNTVNSKPYDHVFIHVDSTTEVSPLENFEVIDLIQEMLPFWQLDASTYPGNPYNHNLFRFYFSDHHPIAFKAKSTKDDD